MIDIVVFIGSSLPLQRQGVVVLTIYDRGDR